MHFMKTKIALAAGFALLILASCAKLDTFSNNNQITDFRVTVHTPETIQLDNVCLEGDTVFIPIAWGKYEFPMKFRAEVTTAANINKIVGLDFDNELSFQDIRSQLRFFVVAENGSTHAYFIKPREIPLSEDNYIYGRMRFTTIDPMETVLSTTAHPSLTGDTVRIYGAGITYPVTITPRFTIADNASFLRFWVPGQQEALFENGVSQMTFNDEESVYHLQVVARSGLVKTWVVSMRNTPLVEERIPEYTHNNISIDPRTSSATASAGFKVEDLLIDNTTGVITVTVDVSDEPVQQSSPSRAAPITSDLSIRFKLAFQDWSDLIGISADTTLTFTGYDDVKVFHLLDPYGLESRRWEIRLNEFKSQKNQVTSFTYAYTAISIPNKTLGGNTTASIVMDVTKATIYPVQKQIVLTYTAYQKDNYVWNLLLAKSNMWGLTLKDIVVTVSPNATYQIPAISWLATGANQSDGLVTQARSFTVTSESGETATWTVSLAHANASASDKCDMTSFEISRVIPNYTRLEAEPVILDQQAGKVMIALKNDDGCYPIQIMPQYALSPYASVVSQENGTQPLVFADELAVQEITVRAQNGNTRAYEVSLLPPVKAGGADITSITFGACSPADFRMTGQPVYDADDASVTIRVESDDAAFPMEVAYSNIVLTEGASVTLAPQGKFTFTGAQEAVSILVKAQNGSIRPWSLKLDYRPQLRNNTLNSWADANNPNPSGYWATPNNSFAKITTRTAGWSGESSDYAANMKTTEIMGNLAAGALYLGTFDSSNILAGLSDPVSLSNFGIRFSPTARIKGVMFDVWYSPAGEDWGNASVDLISWNGVGQYVYHGDQPGKTPYDAVAPHKANTATRVATAKRVYSTSGATTKYGEAATVIPAGTWIKDQFIAVDGGKAFTHLNISFSASAYGDYLIGIKNSEMKVDNVRIVYED